MDLRASSKTTAVAIAIVAGLSAACHQGRTQGADSNGDLDNGTEVGGTTSQQSTSVPADDSQDVSDSVDTSTEVDDGNTSSDDLNTQKFDLGQFPDFVDSLSEGCEKVDFLFVVDNSSSMGDEQMNLANSFPGFMSGIRETISAMDYQVMVIDTDQLAAVESSTCAGKSCECEFDPTCCIKRCGDSDIDTCNGNMCMEIEKTYGCTDEMGIGLWWSKEGKDCEFGAPRSFMTSDQANLDDSFACAAIRGTSGSRDEKPFDAIKAALSPEMLSDASCNQGFLRDDAILVVTLITDEEDNEEDRGSMGNPSDWYQNLVSVKHGDPNALVLIGFIGDRDLANPICTQLSGETGAESSPRLREFFTLAGDRGVAGSVCAPDFGPTFREAIGIIDEACDTFIPPK